MNSSFSVFIQNKVSSVDETESVELMTIDKRNKPAQELKKLEFSGYQHFFDSGKVSAQPSKPNSRGSDTNIGASNADQTFTLPPKKTSQASEAENDGKNDTSICFYIL